MGRATHTTLTKVVIFKRNFWNRSSTSGAAWYSSSRPLWSSPITITNSSTNSSAWRSTSPTALCPDRRRHAVRMSSRSNEWLLANSNTSENLLEDDPGATLVTKISKLPPMTVSKTYDDRLATKDWATKRKWRRTFRDAVSVGNRGVEDALVILKRDLRALSTGFERGEFAEKTCIQPMMHLSWASGGKQTSFDILTLCREISEFPRA